MKIEPRESVWARWPALDNSRAFGNLVDHIYTAAHERLSDGLTVTLACRAHPPAYADRPLQPAQGRRCQKCLRWLERHPEVTVRDTTEEAASE